MNAAVAVVVVNYGADDLLAAHLAGLDEPVEGGDDLDVRIIVVDNFKDDAARAAIRGLADRHRWTLVSMAGNTGFGRAVNAGLDEALEVGCDTVVVLNPDARLLRSDLDRLVARSRANPRAMVSPFVVAGDGSSEFHGSEVGLSTGKIRGLDRSTGLSRLNQPGTPWLTGACLVAPTMLLSELGGFAEDYFLYWEDVDLSFRATAAGIDLLVAGDIEVRHDAGGTQHAARGSRMSALYYRYNTRNRLVFASKHLSRRQRLRWLKATPRESWDILLRGGRRQLLRSPQPLLATLNGAVSGVSRLLIGLRRPGTAAAVLPTTATPGDTPRGRSSAGGPLMLVVAVLTFRRPDELSELLPLLARQFARVNDEGLKAEMLVIDNDPAASARAVVDAVDIGEVSYRHEPEPGISAARTRALAEAGDADLLVFIDDDERPSPHWLEALLRTWRTTGAAAVAGPVRSRFNTPPDAWVGGADIFPRRRLPTGSRLAVAASGNLLLDLRQLRQFGVIAFDQRFGLSGAEDTLFTRSLHAAGGRLVWCNEALVTETVPSDRLTRNYTLQRAFSQGSTAVLVRRQLATDTSRRVRVRMDAVVNGIWCVGLGLVRYLFGRAANAPATRARGAKTAAWGLGKLAGSAGLVYERYGRTGRPWLHLRRF